MTKPNYFTTPPTDPAASLLRDGSSFGSSLGSSHETPGRYLDKNSLRLEPDTVARQQILVMRHTQKIGAMRNALAFTPQFSQAGSVEDATEAPQQDSSEQEGAAKPDGTEDPKTRKVEFINGLIGLTTQFLETHWPETKKSGSISFRPFIEEILRRSRTSYVILNTAMFYLCKATRMPHPAEDGFSDKQQEYRKCGRRMFLASLILATKYLQDCAYTNRAWSRLCGLSAPEISGCEAALVSWLKWELYIPPTMFVKWQMGILQRVKTAENVGAKRPREEDCSCSSTERLEGNKAGRMRLV